MAARREVCQGRAELRPCHSIPLPMTHIGPYLHTFNILCTHAPGLHNNAAVPERSVMVCATMLLVQVHDASARERRCACLASRSLASP